MTMKKLFAQILFLVLPALNSLLAQNSVETNPQGSKGIVYSKGVGLTDIESFYRGGIVSEIPSTFSNTTGKAFKGVIGLSEANGENLGLLGVAKQICLILFPLRVLKDV